MIRNYFDRVKGELFPEITDWTEDFNEFRFHKDVRTLPWKYWFFFHPSAFNFIYYGTFFLSSLIFTGAGLLLYNRVRTLAVIWFLVAGLLMFQFIKKLYLRETKYMTFADMWMIEK